MNGTGTLRSQALVTLLGKCTAALLVVLWLAGCARPVGAPADAARLSPTQSARLADAGRVPPTQSAAAQVAAPSTSEILLAPAATTTPLGLPTEAPSPPACTPSPGAAPQRTPVATEPADPRITTDPRLTRLLAELGHQGASFALEGPSQAAFLAPAPGAAYSGPSGRIYLHPFADASAAARRAAEIPGELDPKRSLIDWVGEPHFYRCDSLLALYLGKDSRTLAALSEICGPEFAKDPLLPAATPNPSDATAATTRLPIGDPAQAAPGAVQPLPQLGKLAFVRGGSIWSLDLSHGQPRQLTQGAGDRNPRWSPSGQWLAYWGPGGAWVVRADGRDAHAVADCGSLGLWAPAADELACRTERGGLDIVQPDGSSRRKVVPPPAEKQQDGGVGTVAWSPDGTMLAYDRLEITKPGTPPESVSSLWRVRADGSGAIELANAGRPSRDGIIVAGWSPDGSHVLYRINEYFSMSILADGSTLWSVPAAGGTPVQVGGNLSSEAGPGTDRVLYHTDFLAWPQRKNATVNELAVTFGGYRSTWMSKRIGLVNAATGQARLLSPADMAATSASWSPDKRFLAYSAMPDTGDLVGGDTAREGMMQRRIYIVNAQGDPQPRQLTNDPAYRDELPLWSAGGEQILFARLDEQARASLWLVPAEGGKPEQVLDGLALDPLSTWFGYYGYIDWQSKFDWWR